MRDDLSPAGFDAPEFDQAWGEIPPDHFPHPHPDAGKIRILFVFAWLVVGGEETEVRLLARHLPRDRYRIDVIPCFRKPGMPDHSHDQLRALGIHVDTAAYDMGFEETVDYLRRRLYDFDVVVSCQDVADIYPALERLKLRPPLIEHGGLVREALSGPKHFTARYVGVCGSIREAAASKMPDRPHHAVEIPSMVDLSEFRPEAREPVRAALGVAPDELLVGWVGRLDRKKRVEDFIEAAAIVARGEPRTRFVVVGGPDAFMPEYADELRHRAWERGLEHRLIFTGDRGDVPDLLVAMDVFCWLSRGEGMPHIIAEAGAARLPVIATPDNGALQQITDGVSGLFVPHEDSCAVADAILRLAHDPGLRARLGQGLRAHVEASYAVEAVVPRWQALIDEVLAERRPPPSPSLFNSFVLGGWESSTHRHGWGPHRDLLAQVGHDTNAAQDYLQLAALGIRTCRDGARWHLIDRGGDYDFSSFTPMVEAARDSGTQVIWDLLHYGWPEDIDIWRPEFVHRFARYARAVAEHVRDLTDDVPFWCPVNEISFHAWAGGDARYLNPYAAGRGWELKCQLARASIAAMVELRAVDPRARFVHAEPMIAIHHADWSGRPRWESQGYHDAQFQAFELIGGWMWPQIGGDPSFLDIVGVNYYWNNQWIHGGKTVDVDDVIYRPLSDLLFEVSARYDRPMLIAETGTEGDRRGPWFDYVAAETLRARARGVPVEGICLYPVANHFGWDDDRLCPNGLLGHDPAGGRRSVDPGLAAALFRSGFAGR
ncbi:glycosyltransferase family 4 protein [Paracoccus sp. (in: a-proteobacteria)]|uniref:glycosyltransferase family 4 protein n=1 Tax=Paracoccus sp. TaxID=267 RepID=UPI0026DF5EAD|nr:glycosyltransferase family 4 protein [Paracoccus sp. (in: a-proteobacteria)]MDO5371139.1 glycosyltransferase family 4 protein [Paracoccus sp. (in: a-proteobacteria)]